MSTTRKLASGSVLRIVNLLATALVSILIMPFVVHAIGDRMYGAWTLVAAIIGYYGTLQIGLAPAINRYMARALDAQDHDECNRVFNTALRLLTTCGGYIPRHYRCARLHGPIV
jgi:O-antigen/teichoic acid export membrane protein